MAEDQSAAAKMTARVLMYCTAACAYCVRAEQLLQRRNVLEIEKIRIDLQPELRVAMMEKTGRRSVPQIYIGDKYVGGYDELVSLDHDGELDKLLAA